MSMRTLVAGATLAAATVLAGTAAVAAPTLYAGNGHYYDFIAGNISWGDALAAADAATPLAGFDSYLVTITDAGEDAFIKALLGSPANEYAWAAGSDDGTEGVWTWRAGPEIGQIFYGSGAPVGAYSNWNGGEPNNLGNEDYLHINANQPRNWNDIYATFPAAGYVVEYSAAVPEPGAWGLMIAGFAGLGAALRARRARTA